jgi:hypothetical protein
VRGKARSEKREARSEKQVPHTARERRDRVPLEDRDQRDDRFMVEWSDGKAKSEKRKVKAN